MNTRIQGPAISTTWSGSRELEVLPLDRVFVVITADVWWDPEKTVPELLKDKKESERSKYVKTVTEGVKTSTERKLYLELRKVAIQSGLDVGDFTAKQVASWKGNDEKVYLTNFSVMQTTSSHMTNYSEFKPASASTGASKKQRVQGQSRMGLEINNLFGTYVVGSWQVGQVLDSAASRGSVPPGAKAAMGVRTSPNTAAHNINVNINFFSADRLSRAYGNGDGFIVPRYVPTKSDALKTAVNAQLPSKEAFNARVA